jgi:hypothetical protein
MESAETPLLENQSGNRHRCSDGKDDPEPVPTATRAISPTERQ